MTAELHTPVLLTEVLQLAAPTPGGAVLDGTLGLGGHAEALLCAVGPTGSFIGLDTDQRNLALAAERLAPFASQLLLKNLNFRKLSEVAEPESLDIVLLDLGISSLHLDAAERGFAFRLAGPLDMRLDATRGETAAQLLHRASVPELTQIFRDYGEIRASLPLAQAIKTHLRTGRLDTTIQLAELVTEVVSGRVLAQVFQALRIAVNDELGALKEALPAALSALRSGGRLVVISFHSLEDRLVKNIFRDWKKAGIAELLTKKPITPTETEIEQNPRARSALLRALRKI